MSDLLGILTSLHVASNSRIKGSEGILVYKIVQSDLYTFVAVCIESSLLPTTNTEDSDNNTDKNDYQEHFLCVFLTEKLQSCPSCSKASAATSIKNLLIYHHTKGE